MVRFDIVISLTFGLTYFKGLLVQFLSRPPGTFTFSLFWDAQ